MALLDTEQTTQPGLLNNPQAIMALALIGGKNPAFANMANMAMQMQQQNAMNQYRQQMMAQQQREMALREKEYNLNEQKTQNQLDQYGNIQTGAKNLADLRGNKATPLSETGYVLRPDSKIVTGSGLLGGQITPQEYQMRAAEELAKMGDVSGASSIIRQQGDQFFQPQQGYDENGNPIYFQADKSGNVKTLMNVKPESTAQKEMAQQDAQYLTKLREEAATATTALDTVLKAEEVLKKSNPFLFGPMVGKIAPYISANSQEVNAYANQLAMLARALYKMPSANFSNADMQKLEKSVLSIEQDPRTAFALSSQIKEMAKRAQDNLMGAEEQFQKRGNLYGITSRNFQQGSQQKQSDPLGLR